MPKVQLNTRQRIRNNQKKIYKKILIDKEIKAKDIADTLGISISNYSNKTTKELKLSLYDLNRIAKKYSLSDKEIAKIIKGE